MFLAEIAIAPSPARAEAPSPYQSDFPPEEFQTGWKVIFDRIGHRAVAILQGAPKARGFVVPRQDSEFSYFRCEDVIAITETGYENFTDFLPSELDDIEKLVGRGGMLQEFPASSESHSNAMRRP
jgi:hypothetical protein